MGNQVIVSELTGLGLDLTRTLPEIQGAPEVAYELAYAKGIERYWVKVGCNATKVEDIHYLWYRCCLFFFIERIAKLGPRKENDRVMSRRYAVALGE